MALNIVRAEMEEATFICSCHVRLPSAE